MGKGYLSNKMSELVKLLVFSVFLCSCTQSKDMLCQQNLIMTLWLLVLGRLVQVDGNGAICSNHIALLWCTSDDIPFLSWDIRTRSILTLTFSFDDGDPVRSTKNLSLNSSSIVAQLTSNNGSFNATVTIMRPINLNGSSITCNGDKITLNIPMTGKFFCFCGGSCGTKIVVGFLSCWLKLKEGWHKCICLK